MAINQKLKGWVANTSSGVFIRINSSKSDAENFLKIIIENTPDKAKIINHNISETEKEQFEGFTINNSFDTVDGKIILPPDFALCEDCEKELLTDNNRRFSYPFITCTNCGPRYSIISKLPYDRENTSMHNFAMCKECSDEYNSTNDRRFYSQTNSCKKCGVKLSDTDGESSQSKIIDKIVEKLIDGDIVAVKGIGGYLFLVDANNKISIEKLRKRKNRPTKPFALLVNDEKSLKRLVKVTDCELRSWKSTEAEIVLFEAKNDTSNFIAIDKIAPSLNRIGVMKPYAPILKLISGKFKTPLIATSANLSGSPIIYNDNVAKKHLSNIADYIVFNDREILVPQDDSVVQFSKNNTRIVLRRSRGIAPNFFGSPINFNQEIVAVGSLLKSAFTFYKNKQFYISQYLGNTIFLESQQAYDHTYRHLSKVLKINPEVVISDLHPDYFSSEFANNIEQVKNIKHVKVQHHEAHFMAVVGEHNLTEEEILGFVWDGTGLGSDGEIWGSEVFHLKNKSIKRLYHSKYEKHILADKMVNEPRISALSFFNEIGESKDILKLKFNKNEYDFYTKAISKSKLQTSSMGRFFDAVASILNVKDISDYDGETAMLLETFANSFEGNIAELKNYKFKFKNGEIDFSSTKTEIISDLKKGISESEIAMKFHLTLVELIKQISEKLNLHKLAFSGGVFQNALLVSLIELKLGEQNILYFHKQLSTNDECISFGQIIRYTLD
jgi:hydrogenase maturation protein HypF